MDITLMTRVILGSHTDGRKRVLDEIGGGQHNSTEAGAKQAETWRGGVK